MSSLSSVRSDPRAPPAPSERTLLRRLAAVDISLERIPFGGEVVVGGAGRGAASYGVKVRNSPIALPHLWAKLPPPPSLSDFGIYLSLREGAARPIPIKQSTRTSRPLGHFFLAIFAAARGDRTRPPAPAS